VITGAVIGVDPGRVKAGYAILDTTGAALEQGICPVEALPDRLRPMVVAHGATTIALGGGTSAKAVAVRLESLGLPICLVDEYETTRFARELYFADHPPRGWRRMLPRGLLSPGRPVDDYAAILIGRRYLEARVASPARGDA
jgi:RNase H-fold protein (predicted Holliday junction resolvase)